MYTKKFTKKLNPILTCIIPVPAILNEAVPATMQNVDGEIQGTTQMAYKYTGRYIHTSCHDSDVY